MEHQVALNFEDGVTRFISTRVGETVADASYRQGINIPMDCRDGVCGTCRCFVEEGTFESGDYLEDAMTTDEAAQGYGLACQMRAGSDMVLRIAAGSDVCKTKPGSHAGTVLGVERLSDTTLALTVALAAPVAFLPGQYVNIDVPGSVQKRSYSFASAPGADRAVFLVRNIPGGLMTTYLQEQAAPGAALGFTGPVGSFYLREIRRPVLMLAGGTGLAPFLSMLERIAATGAAHPVHLLYGVTRDVDLVETARLDALQARIPGFTWAACVADAGSAHPSKGYVTDHMDPGVLHGGDVDVYLCGPPPMVDAVRDHFAAAGVVPASFHYEKFSPSGVVAAAA